MVPALSSDLCVTRLYVTQTRIPSHTHAYTPYHTTHASCPPVTLISLLKVRRVATSKARIVKPEVVQSPAQTKSLVIIPQFDHTPGQGKHGAWCGHPGSCWSSVATTFSNTHSSIEWDKGDNSDGRIRDHSQQGEEQGSNVCKAHSASLKERLWKDSWLSLETPVWSSPFGAQAYTLHVVIRHRERNSRNPTFKGLWCSRGKMGPTQIKHSLKNKNDMSYTHIL